MSKKQRESADTPADGARPPYAARKSALSMAVTAALTGALAMPGVVLAQDDSEEQDGAIEEVVTYGKYSASLLNSIAAKRDNSSIVEAISAEDIGKLPDVSIAESLARLPGLTVQRLNGRGQVVNVRGMSPDFSTGVLNGREQVSVGDNRGVEFDQYPSELLQQVIVYKTPDAALIGQGLSGTVDMRTVRPLDHGERSINLNARYERAEYDIVSNRDNDGNRFSATYIDQFADDTVGLVLGYAHTTSPSLGRNNNAWGYYVGDGAGNVAIGGGRVWARASELERDSVVAALDLRPNDQLEVSIDAFVSSFKEDQIKHGLVMNLDGGAMTPTRVENGVVVEGTYGGNTTLATENNVFLRDSDLQSFGANVEYAFNNDWVLTADLSHSSIDRSDTAEFESNGGLGGAGGLNDIVRFVTSGTGTRFEVGRDYSNLDYASGEALYATSPYGWGDPNALAPYVPAGQFGYNKVFDVEDDLNAFRAELERELDWGAISGVEMGFNVTDREKSRVANEGVITSGLTDAGGALLTEVEIPADIAGTADLGGWGLIGSNTRIISYDPYALLAAGQIQQGAYLYDDILAKAWVVDEDVNTLYVKFDVDWQLGDMPLLGNFGLQYQWWDQASTGQNASGAGANLVSEFFSDSADGSEVLPSVNLTLEIADNQKVRLGLARTLARPRMDELKASGFYGYNVANIDNTRADVDALIATGVSELQALQTLSPWSRSGGNTQLEPWLADSIDLSYEYYFADSASYIAAAVFYKDLDTYIFDQTLKFDFTGLPPQGPAPQLFEGTTTSPQNGKGGSIDGWELAATIQMDMFSDALRGFGIAATYSRNESKIEPNGPGSGSRLPGLSKNVWNVTAFFEREGFSARINQRHRDGFVGEVAGFGGARTGSDIAEETILDAQISYEFQSGPLDGLNVLLQGLNLTDEPFRSLDVSTGLPTEYQTFGASYILGFSYSIY